MFLLHENNFYSHLTFSDGQDLSLGQLDHPYKFMDLNFIALEVSLWKDLNLPKNILHAQKTDSIFRVGFTLSKWFHFHGANLLPGMAFISRHSNSLKKVMI